MIFLYIFLSILGAVLALTLIEILIFLSQKPARELPDKSTADYYARLSGGKSFEDLYLFLSGQNTDTSFTEDEIYNVLLAQCDYMSRRFDCADFRAQLLFKIYKDCEEHLSSKCKELIEGTFLGFKYFMDEPGDDSMCYWSENHQIMFAVAEYLVGQQWPDKIFTNDKKSGREHKEKAKLRIDAWMQQRFNFGFSEYLSNNYLAEDISPMANYIAYSEDKHSVEQMKIIMDILWLDVAHVSTCGRFVSTSTRMYGNNKMGNFYGNSIQCAINELWGKEIKEKLLQRQALCETEKALIKASLEKKPNHIIICFTDIVKKGIYTLPQAIKDIALSDEAFSAEMSCGLSPEDLKNEGLIGQEPHKIMAQLGAEAFTNPEVTENTIDYIKKNRLYRNAFIGYFRFLELSVLKTVNWSRFARRHNIKPHGIATGRGNIYSYRTPHYSMSTSARMSPDLCGAQEQIWCADIGEALTVFTTHPAGNGNSRFGSSPGYWIGNGRRPVSVQNKNVNVTIYRLPEKKRLGETSVSRITHVYMPMDFYDEFEFHKNIVLARKNGVFVSVQSNGELKFRKFDEASAKGLMKNKSFAQEYTLRSEFDLIRQGGNYHIYITELSDEDTETFAQFKERIKSNPVTFGEGTVCYSTKSGVIQAFFNDSISTDGHTEKTEYDRYSSKFCKAKRKADSITVDSGKNRLYLNLSNCERLEEKIK